MTTHAPVRNAGPEEPSIAAEAATTAVVRGAEPGRPERTWLRATGDAAWRFIGIVAVIALVVYLISLVQIVFVAVYLALVLTAVLLPLGNLYDRALPRGLAMIASLLTLLAVVGGLTTYVVSTIAARADDLTTQLTTGLDSLAQSLPFDVGTSEQWLVDGGTWFEENSGAVLDQALQGANLAATGATVVVLGMFLTIFFLTGGGAMWRWFVDQLPARARRNWEAAGETGWRTFSGYTRGIAFVALADATMAGVFLTVMNNPLALPLTVVVFLAVFVPMVGPVAAIVISAVVTLATGDPTSAIIVAVGMTVIAQIDANVLQPLITGKQVNLHPVAMALAITCGTVLAGLLGAVIAVPLTAVSWAVFSRLRARPDEAGEDVAGDGAGPPTPSPDPVAPAQ
ncbi:AI-2E family transporter [Myceligenerans pegani]|uniref:AI-2E family transporter n=1 Tax=Myceligenerans pegani TaxID=2776917 RepID=A0ABR9MU11_9MICO|nr:AI-2E family transporter [Myceligenerans sp. TRM 65318]MBE1874252.1 AI-2E family transporter [Myceligenerans sp. TRM 65318]MBE3016523.1 AI-2E family transporter [Myceligenerans sp. TRM 65318]